MYAFAIAFYMFLNVKDIYKRLSAIEGGFAAFSKLEWVMAVLAILMVPMAVLMLIKAYRDLKKGVQERKEAAAQAELEKQQRMQNEYFLEDGPADEEAAEILRQAADVAQPEKAEEDNKSVFDS
ncbi:MAG: hypothetical protein IKV55_05900 [Oscillospiraceae bacterium]|nr:hypothetical protein [Oscillospiraceae bacterium]